MAAGSFTFCQRPLLAQDSPGGEDDLRDQPPAFLILRYLGLKAVATCTVGVELGVLQEQFVRDNEPLRLVGADPLSPQDQLDPIAAGRVFFELGRLHNPANPHLWTPWRERNN